MGESINNNHSVKNEIIKIDKEIVQELNDKNIKLNIFEPGLVITEDVKGLLSIFDKDKNGILDEKEIDKFQKAIYNLAHCDGNNKLSLNELKMLFKNNNIGQQLKALLERMSSGKSETTTTNKLPDGTVVTTVSKFNKDGSGTCVKTSVRDGEIISTMTATYIKGGLLKSVVKESSNGKVETNYQYNEQNKRTKAESSVYDKKGNITQTNVKTNEWDENGNLKASHSVSHSLKNGKKICIEKTDTAYECHPNSKPAKSTTTSYSQDRGFTKNNSEYNENGQIIHSTNYKKDGIRGAYKETSQTDYTYNANNKLSQSKTYGTDPINGPFEIYTTFAEDGTTMTYQERTYGKRGARHKEFYNGANINNRAGALPSECIIYDTDGITVKKRIVNEFDERGILTGRKEFDKNGNLLNEHTFSREPDGVFETAYQIGRGDCYLLASINSLNQSEEGRKVLSELIKGDGKGNYTVKFKGAELAKKALIDGTGNVNIGKLPANKVHIKSSYTISAAELDAALLKAGSKYSAGDIDFLILELAYEKYRKDVAKTIRDNKLDPNKTQYIAGLDTGSREQQGDYLSGGKGEAATFILTGKQAETWRVGDRENVPVCYIDSDYNMHISNGSGLETITETSVKAITVSINGNGKNGDIDKLLNQLKEDYRDGKLDNYSATAGFMVSSQEINGEIVGKGGHALAIIGVTDDKVILSNPWSPNDYIEMSIEDFKKAATALTCTKIADVPQNNPQSQPANNSTTNQLNQSNQTVSQANNTSASTTAPQAGKKYKVPNGKSYTALIKEALQQQNIPISKENIKKAKAQFETTNPGLVKIYHGKKREWHGNKYLITDSVVKIPKFNIT